jgi:hypothetical protein
VTAAEGTRYSATAGELAHWRDIAQRSGTPRKHARRLAFDLLVSFAWIRAYRRFLRESGQTVDDNLFGFHVDMLSKRIRRQVVELAEASVTDAAIDAYLAEHGPPRLPERRDLRIVLTDRRSAAVAAKRELLDGASWSTVVRRHSIDEASRRLNARQPDAWRSHRQCGGYGSLHAGR